ncbi:LytTR family DNA-binding domain-containing protein [uncultured Roseivirga sp.]|uniref:LytR/AlgR family response regulator transcription factor n=1 Tax=uncultured Roseivirga sp. TaxID=543088 RepID=UPI0030DBF713|tara:strand:+ start:592 stop:1353 length:762 start_codon:yes stop_codon:yes gene_type:complete
MRCVIIDDEKNVIEIIKKLLTIHCPHVEIIGEATSCRLGELLITEKRPDLVFIDIELTDGTGIDLIRKLNLDDLNVVFITAHNKYAIDAFELSALDFLLKPISVKALTEAVSKCERILKAGMLQMQMRVLLDSLKNSSSPPVKIVLSDQNSLHFVKVDDIMWCTAEGSYTRFKLIDNSEILVSKNLKTYESILNESFFSRIHHSYLVNINHIKRYDKNDGGVVIMSNNEGLPVSIRKKDSLLIKLRIWGETQI